VFSERFSKRVILQALAAYQIAADKGKGANKQAQEKVRNMLKLVRQRAAKAT
jgi:hypothetical protein